MPSARAATFTVTNGNNSGTGSLRAAVASAARRGHDRVRAGRHERRPVLADHDHAAHRHHRPGSGRVGGRRRRHQLPRLRDRQRLGDGPNQTANGMVLLSRLNIVNCYLGRQQLPARARGGVLVDANAAAALFRLHPVQRPTAATAARSITTAQCISTTAAFRATRSARGGAAGRGAGRRGAV